MDLKSGYPFWAVKNGLMHAFPKLGADLQCDVAIIGAGITGALIADELAAHGHEVAVLDQRDVAWGSTCASTALLQYEIDTHMTELADRYGEADAAKAYLACRRAIDELEHKARDIGNVDFANMHSLYYASRSRDKKSLREEFELRRKHGLEMRWLDENDVDSEFGFKAPCAILSERAARIDPYRMTYRLLQRLQRQGSAIHDRTSIAHIVATSRGVELETTEGHRIKAGHLVMAAGYASQAFLDASVARNRSSYAFITDPIDTSTLGKLSDTMMWESARPYLYMRTTGDNRLLIGGEDDSIDIPAKRDARVNAKARTLARKVNKLFPHLDVVPAFAWAGTFAETPDGLPWFGAHKQHGPRVLFAMAYGGNGITYSQIGSEVLRAGIERRRHPLSALFGFGRLARS
ncbi:MAG: FAD-dependent oxidoreductase [Thermomonas sp.]